MILVLMLLFQYPQMSSSALVASTLFGHSWSESAFALEIDLNDRTDSFSLIADLTPGEEGNQEDDLDPSVDFEQFFAYVNTSQLELAFIAQERWQEEVDTEIQIDFEGHSFNVDLKSVINGSFPLIGFLGHLEHTNAEYYFGGTFLGLLLEKSSGYPQEDLLIGYPLSDTRILEWLENQASLNSSLRNSESLPFFEVEDGFYRFGICYRNLTIFWHNGALSDGIVLRPSSFGATTFSWINFSFILRPQFGHVQGRAVASLVPVIDIGPVSLLVMSEDEIPAPLDQWMENPTNISVNLDFKDILDLPENYTYSEEFQFVIYQGVDVSTRLSLEGALNLSVLMALNGYSSSTAGLEITGDGLPIEFQQSKQSITSNLTIKENETPVFLLNQVGKDRYVSYDNSGGQVLKKAGVSGISLSAYNQLSRTLYEAEYELLSLLLIPFIVNTTTLFANNSGQLPDQLSWTFSSALGHYFVELDQWNGMKLHYDPEFFFFLVGESEFESQDSSSISISLVGFLASLMCLSIGSRIYSRKKYT